MKRDDSESTTSTQITPDKSMDRDPEKAQGDDAQHRRSGPSNTDGELPVPTQDREVSKADDKDIEKAQRDNALAPAPTHDPAYEVHFDGLSDPFNPRGHYSKSKKWLFVCVCSSTSFCVTCASSLYTMTYGQLEEEFGSDEIVATLGLSLFVIGLGLGPMLLGPLSEVSQGTRLTLYGWTKLTVGQFYGRKPIYIISLCLFVIWLIPCAVAQNIQTMLVCRFIDGFAGSAFLSVSGGTVGDLFDKTSLQAPMMIFTCSPFLGPVVGPIVGGFINQFASWYEGRTSIS